MSTFPNTTLPPEHIQAVQQQAADFWATHTGARLLATKNSLPIASYRKQVGTLSDSITGTSPCMLHMHSQVFSAMPDMELSFSPEDVCPEAGMCDSW